jgi:hypothetical protein
LRQAYDYWQNQPGNYLGRAGAPKHPARFDPAEAEQNSSLRGGGPRGRKHPRSPAPTAARRGARLHTGAEAIQLPPLSSPRGLPPHNRSGAEAPSRGVIWAPQEEGAVHRATSGDGCLLGPSPKCLEISIPNGQLSRDSIRARQPQLTGRQVTSRVPGAEAPCAGRLVEPPPSPSLSSYSPIR